MTTRHLVLVSTLVVAVSSAGSTRALAQEPIDRAMIAKIRAEGLDRSRVVPMFDTLATVFGPRLAGGPAFLRAVNWSKDHLAGWGVANAALEPFPFGRGWDFDQFVIEMVEPRYMPLVGYPSAWTPGTPGVIVATPVLTAGKTFAEVEKMAGRLKGGILMQGGIQSNFIVVDRVQPTDPNAPPPPPPAPARGGNRGAAPPANAAAAADAGRGGNRGGTRGATPAGAAPAPQTDAQRIARLIADSVPAVTLSATRGEHGSLFLQGGSYRGDPKSSGIVLAAEHYNMIVRLLENGVPVKLRVNVRARYLTADTNCYNIVGEIPGTDPRLRDQVVMIGAHIDSWHSALGAADNADGAAIALEAMRILKAVGAQPRRTIRVGIWGAEEEGLLGSKAWVAKHLADSVARSKFSIYFNMDPGTGPIYGFYMQGNTKAKPIFDAWMEPFKDLGYRKNVEASIGNTDHLTFTGVGVPGFNPIQDYTDYDTRIHHTNWDTPERVPPQELKNASVIFASLLWHAAQRDEMFPR